MNKPEVHIENWQRHEIGQGAILTGNVTDHPCFAPGTFVYTSRIESEDGNRVETRNTNYVLGKKYEPAGETLPSIDAREA